MRVAINAQLLSGRRFGIENYLYHLLEALKRIDGDNQYELFVNSPVKELSGAPFRQVVSNLPVHNSLTRILWEQTVMPFLAGRADVFHNPDHVLPFAPIRARTVITVHDLAFYVVPETFSFRKRAYKKLVTPQSLRRANAIVADSHSTKRDVVELFRVPADKVTVVHPGVNPEFTRIGDRHALSAFRASRGLGRPFILFVGTIEPRKNIARLIEAFEIVRGKGATDLDLVIAGGDGWLSESIYRRARSSPSREHISFSGFIPAEELPLLYNCAEVFAFPSLYEGFGLPPLEAMACGVPVVTARVSSLPEVVGDSALSVSPSDAEELAHALERACGDTELRRQLVASGLERAKRFTWDDCAIRTRAVYKRAATVR
jgi:glycosyltransferase involved in cell wall biosynthesis